MHPPFTNLLLPICSFMRKASTIQLLGWEDHQSCSKVKDCCLGAHSPWQAQRAALTHRPKWILASASVHAVPTTLASSRHCLAWESTHQSSAAALGTAGAGTPAIKVLWKRQLALPGWPCVYLSFSLSFPEQNAKLRPPTRLTHIHAPSRTPWWQLSLRIDTCKKNDGVEISIAPTWWRLESQFHPWLEK